MTTDLPTAKRFYNETFFPLAMGAAQASPQPVGDWPKCAEARADDLALNLAMQVTAIAANAAKEPLIADIIRAVDTCRRAAYIAARDGYSYTAEDAAMELRDAVEGLIKKLQLGPGMVMAATDTIANGVSKMPNLYELNKDAFDRLAAMGRPSLGEMAKHFAHPVEMDRALGTDSAVNHWLRGRNGASMTSERAAAYWLKAHVNSASAKAESATSNAATTGGKLLLVVCNAETERTLKTLAGILGFELVQV